MATKARQQYFADESSLSKERREFSIADDIQQKIDSIEPGAEVNAIETIKVNGTALTPDANKAVNINVPDVIDNLYTVDATDALSAKQGKILYDYIQNLLTIGRFLSNWNSATGLPVTNPSESPYAYKAGDYYRVSNVATSPATNYKPNGSSYTIGVASTTVETLTVSVSDMYLYDGTDWILLSNSGSPIAIDSSLSTTSTNPVENRVITNAINLKANDADISVVGKTNDYTDLDNLPSIPDSLDDLTGTSDDITEGQTNLFLTGSERTKLSNTSGVNTGDETNATIKSKLGQASSLTDGYLTSTDWNTFNGKQDTLTAGANISIQNNTVSATDTTYSAGTGLSLTGTTFANTGVTSVNGSTGTITVAETESKVFEMPSVSDDISDIISWLTAGKVAILFDGDMSTPGDYAGKYYQVGDWDESNGSIYAYQSVPGESTVTGKGIYYSSGIVTDVFTDTKLLAPSGGTQGQVLTQNSTGIPSWQNASGGAEIEYVTQAEYTALLPGAASDGKHYFIYSTSGGGGWQPGANTIGYYTMDNDILNHATTGSTFPDGVLNTATFSTTKAHGDNTYSLYCDGSSYAYLPGDNAFEFRTSNFTISCWVYSLTNSGQYPGFVSNGLAPYPNMGRAYRISDRFNNSNEFNFCRNGTDWNNYETNTSIYNDGWHNCVITRSSGVVYIYLDGVLKGSLSNDTSANLGTQGNIFFGYNIIDQLYSTCYLNDVIFENVAWSAQEVSDYYTATA